MRNNKYLLKELSAELQKAENYLNELDKTEALPNKLISVYQLDLLALQHKDIPAELCSSGKLIERIREVTTLIDNVKWELGNFNKKNC